jgi:hypothetical protein
MSQQTFNNKNINYYFDYNQSELINQNKRVIRNYNNYVESLKSQNSSILKNIPKNANISFLYRSPYNYMFIQYQKNCEIFIYIYVNGIWTYAGKRFNYNKFI